MTLNRFSSQAVKASNAFEGSAPEEISRALEACQASLRRACFSLSHWNEPPLDLSAMAAALKGAYTALFNAVDGRVAGAGAFSDFLRALDGTSGFLSPLLLEDANAAMVGAAIGEARRGAGIAKDWYGMQKSLKAPDGENEPWLLASADMPQVFEIARPSFSPKLRVASPVPPAPAPELQEKSARKAASFEELQAALGALKNKAAEKRKAVQARATAKDTIKLDAQPAKASIPIGFARLPNKGMSALNFVRARTREWFEEIAMVGMQRAPLLGDPWRIALPLERRMLRAIDGIAAFGSEALLYLPEIAMDAPAPDPMRIFALTMALGCFSGRDALAIAEYVLLAGEPDAEVIGGFGAAMKLIPSANTNVFASLRSLLSESDPELRAMAVDALGYRGILSREDLFFALSDKDSRVRAKAIWHSAGFSDASLPSLLLAESRSGDGPCRDAARMALLRRSDRNISIVLEEELMKEPRELTAVLMALCADESLARRFVELCSKKPCAELAAALGWLGACNSIELLISFLESQDDALRGAAAWALERITGAGLWESAAALDEEILLAEPAEPDLKEPKPPALARTVSDAEDLPPAAEPEMVEQPSLNPLRWKAYWMENGMKFDYNGRYRAGRPFTPEVVLDELDRARRTPAERRLLQIELAMRTGGWVSLDPHDWVAVQEDAIRLWRPIAFKASSQPGKWAFPW